MPLRGASGDTAPSSHARQGCKAPRGNSRAPANPRAESFGEERSRSPRSDSAPKRGFPSRRPSRQTGLQPRARGLLARRRAPVVPMGGYNAPHTINSRVPRMSMFPQAGRYSRGCAPRPRMKRGRDFPSSAMEEVDVPMSAVPKSVATRRGHDGTQTLWPVGLDGDEAGPVQPEVAFVLEQLPLGAFDVALEDVDLVNAEPFEDLGHRHCFTVPYARHLLDRRRIE